MSVRLIPFNRGWFELRKIPHCVHVCLIPFIGIDLNWEKLRIVCLSIWFHLISFFSQNNCFRAKRCGTLKIDRFIRYNVSEKYFFFQINIYWHSMKKLVKNMFFSILTLKIKFASIFIIIFVMSASKYVDIVSFKLIGVECFSEV